MVYSLMFSISIQYRDIVLWVSIKFEEIKLSWYINNYVKQHYNIDVTSKVLKELTFLKYRFQHTYIFLVCGPDTI